MARCCFALLACGRNATTRRNTGLGATDGLAGDAECAATQTWQVVDSSWLECRCTANANADHNVSNSDSHATRFETDRMISLDLISNLQ